MFRLGLRFFGLCLLAAAFATLIVDVRHSVTGGSVYVTTTGAILAELDPAKLAAAKIFIEHHLHLHLMIWDPFLTGLMRLPVSLGFAALGGLLIWLARKPAPKFGFSSR
jgi:hypothetical protein